MNRWVRVIFELVQPTPQNKFLTVQYKEFEKNHTFEFVSDDFQPVWTAQPI